jgi:glycosyltransferase involved in cell wall biosynthesis
MSSVDVVVPCYRYGHFLEQCVNSVLDQANVSVRVLVIDDASPDDTAAVASALAHRDARVHFIRHPVNRGHIATYNEGLAWASADYVLLLSADDYLLPGALARATVVLDAHPQAAFAFGHAIVLADGDADHSTRIHNARKTDGAKVVSGPKFVAMSGAGNMVATPTAVVRTRLQHAAGGYRPELPHSGDMEMWLRLAALGSVAILRADQAIYRRHATNMSTAYYVNSRLPDLEHRRQAIDSFFADAGRGLPKPQRAQQRMYQLLAREALTLAGEAFDEDEAAAVDALTGFAATMDPRSALSLPAVKLTVRRWLGRRGWHAVRELRARWF